MLHVSEMGSTLDNPRPLPLPADRRNIATPNTKDNVIVMKYTSQKDLKYVVGNEKNQILARYLVMGLTLKDKIQ
jgi:hypothetical protein